MLLKKHFSPRTCTLVSAGTQVIQNQLSKTFRDKEMQIFCNFFFFLNLLHIQKVQIFSVHSVLVPPPNSA